MACYLMAPSHYLNQYQLIISPVTFIWVQFSHEILWPSIAKFIINITYIKFHSILLGANELRHLSVSPFSLSLVPCYPFLCVIAHLWIRSEHSPFYSCELCVICAGVTLDPPWSPHDPPHTSVPREINEQLTPYVHPCQADCSPAHKKQSPGGLCAGDCTPMHLFDGCRLADVGQTIGKS